MFSGSVNAGFILALSFHHGEPDYVGVSTGVAYVREIPLQDFVLKMQRGGLYARVFAGHYSIM